jgi:hypothetical protein
MPNGQAYLELEIDLVDSQLSHAGLTGHGLDEALGNGALGSPRSLPELPVYGRSALAGRPTRTIPRATF